MSREVFPEGLLWARGLLATIIKQLLFTLFLAPCISDLTTPPAALEVSVITSVLQRLAIGEVSKFSKVSQMVVTSENPGPC